MKPIHTFNLVPALPPSLERLRDLAYNLRWSWDHATIELFRRLDSDLWETTGHNPVLMLGRVDQAKLEAAAADDAFLSHFEGILRYFDRNIQGQTSWFRQAHGAPEQFLVGYFSAEFGITECLSIFAGGLGILAGDHLKSTSDLGVPLVGVGLLYQQGYFSQYLNEAGWQQEAYEDNDFHNLPLSLERRPDGRPVTVEVAYPGRRVTAQLWRADVGRVPLYLLDTNIPVNSIPDRDITDQLYGGDKEMRLKQEILLGIGGYRALEELGIKPSIFHMNEGHSAFLALELVRRLMETGRVSFAEAREAAAAALVFTTHTPVAAGHDYFAPDLMQLYFKDYARDLGLSWPDFMALGRTNPANEGEEFCMTVLSLSLASHSTGVSPLHGEVSRKMWQVLWPGLPESEVPISDVANGVHFRSWISREMDNLYQRYLGPRWREEPLDRGLWARARQIPAEELWRTHERRRERLVAFTRRRLRDSLIRRGAPQAEVDGAAEVLSPEVLTLGFARRFATYKRAALLLRDPERLERIVNNPERPVQVIFAGKAHPRDDAGKDLIRQIITLARQSRFRRRLVFLEDYDMAISRYLVQGVDVWLNTPRRPREASGTSGMKAAANGALNVSTLDGWWDGLSRQPINESVGWTIGRGESYSNPDYQDQVEAESLYGLLEQDIVPAFYERNADDLPRRWIDVIKASLEHVCHHYNSHRMVREYTERFYLPSFQRSEELRAEGMGRARQLAAWKERLHQAWPEVRIEAVDGDRPTSIQVNSDFRVRARVRLGTLIPSDVAVELYEGSVDADGEIIDARLNPMDLLREESPGVFLFETTTRGCCRSGLHGYTLRVIPSHPDLPNPFLPGLITWASDLGA